jgi:hypothetical protein
MIKLKSHSVFLDNLHPVIWTALPIIEAIFDHLEKDVIITSARDSTHSANSLHYAGRAIDLRSQHLSPSYKQLVLSQLKITLGRDWDVLLEDPGTTNEHYHLEYQPKGPILSTSPIPLLPLLPSLAPSIPSGPLTLPGGIDSGDADSGLG